MNGVQVRDDDSQGTDGVDKHGRRITPEWAQEEEVRYSV